MGRPLRADTSPPLPLKFTSTYFLLKLYSLILYALSTCIVVAALGSFISRDETASLRG